MCSCVGDPITTDSELPPDNNPSNQSNEGLVAGISVTVIIIVVLIMGGAVILIIFYVRQNTTLQGILMRVNT